MIFLFTLIIVIFFTTIVIIFVRQPKFGRLPSGERLKLVTSSPHYRDGKFHNLSHTPDLTEGVSYWDVMYEFFFKAKVGLTPVDTIPSIRTDLFKLSPDENVLVWFGHSSYFMQIDGKKILVDPVFSGAASPLSFTVKAFNGTNVYTTDDLPEIDYLFISHDHWDHVDHETLLRLKPKIKKVICGLGTGEHFEYWGYDKEIIVERDWNQEVPLSDGFTAYTVPARHFSGRGLARNKSLWTAFVLETPSLKIYIGGDSGYDTHFAEAGEKFGPFDLAILENGQYDKKWRYIHLLPEEVLLAAKDLKAKRLFPVHSSKFSLGNHAWDEPLIKLTENNSQYGIPLVTPKIGEVVYLSDSTQQFSQWWKGIK